MSMDPESGESMVAGDGFRATGGAAPKAKVEGPPCWGTVDTGAEDPVVAPPPPLLLPNVKVLCGAAVAVAVASDPAEEPNRKG